jgi:hypothetical protein
MLHALLNTAAGKRAGASSIVPAVLRVRPGLACPRAIQRRGACVSQVTKQATARAPAPERANGNGHEESRPRILLRSALEIAGNPCRTPWLLRPYIPRAAMVLLYGEEGSLKSFLALDWALQVAQLGSTVIYLHAEGSGLWKRLRAWAVRHYPGKAWAETLNVLPFLAVERPLNLSADAVLLELQVAISELGRAPALIVVDTLSRNSDGTPEGSTADATKYLNRLDQGIRAPFGASVILVHHVGHAARDRARGPIVFTANTEANFRIERPDPKRLAINVISGRMKDGPPPDPFELEAEVITLDEVDEQGTPETSLALRATGAVPAVGRREPKGRNQQLFLGALREHVRAAGCDVISTVDLLAIAKAQKLSRQRLPEVRAALQRDGWLAESVGGVRLLGDTP